jgi:superfamily II DNA helicase RecQ
MLLDHHVVNLVNCRNFGLSSFRSGQKEIIENALMLRDVFVLIPTGGGKCLCYHFLLGAVPACQS